MKEQFRLPGGTHATLGTSPSSADAPDATGVARVKENAAEELKGVVQAVTQAGRRKACTGHVATEQLTAHVRDAFSAQTMAVRVLSLALLSEVETLAARHESGGARRIDFTEEVCRFEAALILSALERTGGRQRRAAYLLNMSKSRFNAKVKRYGIEWNPSRRD